jgi:ATP-binding cassette subfamily B protein
MATPPTASVQTPPATSVPKRSGWATFSSILRYLPRYRGALVFGVVCLVASQVIQVLTPLVLREALSVLEGGRDALARGGDPAAVAANLALLYVGAVLVQGLLVYTMRWKIVGLSRDLERDLKDDLFGHVARLPVSFFDRMRTGDLLSRLTSDVEAVRFSVGPGVMYLSQTAVKFPLAIGLMLWMDWRLTLLLLVPLSGVALIVRLTAPSILRRSRAVQDRLADLSARAQESFAGARVVRAYATEPVEEAAFSRRNEDLLAENLGLAKRRAGMMGGLRLMGDLGILAVLWFGGHRVMEGGIGHGTLVAFLAYGDLLLWPMISLGYVLASFQRAVGAMNRIDEVLAEPAEPETTLEAAAPLPDRFRGALSVRRLTFSYPGSARPALVDVSVEVPAGATLALVGPVGGGKSTLAACLARLYDVPPGTVFVDGVDVDRVPLSRLRAAVAFVPQDGFLFSDTIRANLLFGVRSEVPAERVEEAAVAAGLGDDLARFPAGLDTVVGERGLTLSGGQKQRATIARALLRGGDVLVLDDALSAVDTRTEAKILDGLAGEKRGRTCVIVAHRLSTVRDADVVLVLDQGRVVERGTHATLLEAGGWYARTYALQRLHAEIEDLS